MEIIYRLHGLRGVRRQRSIGVVDGEAGEAVGEEARSAQSRLDLQNIGEGPEGKQQQQQQQQQQQVAGGRERKRIISAFPAERVRKCPPTLVLEGRERSQIEDGE
ncbi:hypothetical protein E2320_005003 [Naja naja]|nr:hypothetical protein E2320_005003 [Naja naja]